MGTEEKINECFQEELAKSMRIRETKDLPETINVVSDDLPEIERWVYRE